jgi:replicative DNA helicase
MTDVQYGIRILAKGTSVSNMRMRTGDLSEKDWEQLTDSMMLYSNHDIRFMFSTKYIEDLRAEVEAMKEQDGLDMLIVDYVQLLQTKQRFDKDYQRIGFISKALKDMSTELNIAVIALAQVGRSTEGDMPSLSELRGSGDLEQDADNVLFLHRPEEADDRWVKPSERGVFDAIQSMKCQYIVMNVAKQRQGETGPVTCMFNPRAMLFEPIGKEG